MSKFNATIKPEKKYTYEGARGFAKDPAEDFMNFLFSSYLETTFYESQKDQQKRYLAILDDVCMYYGAEFIAKAAVFTRQELGMRSISHLTAAYLNDKKFDGKRYFFKKICHRVDDTAEILAAVDMLGQKRSHSLVRGLADYLSTVSEYALGKYKMQNKDYNLYDVINITHANSSPINKYKANALATPDTWEVKISTAEDAQSRNLEWQRLLKENKLGFLALIRNLNNIAKACSYAELEKYLVQQLKNKEAVKKSLVFPYQIFCAYLNSKSNLSYKVIAALEEAFIYSIDNIPSLDGNNLIIMDVSGSMDSFISKKSQISIKNVGACFAAALYYKNPNSCDFIKFASDAKKEEYSNTSSPFTMIEKLSDNANLGYRTDFYKVVPFLKDSYTRIFIISDMQILDYCTYSYNMDNYDIVCEYQKNYGKTNIYSFDLGNYPMQFLSPNNNIHLLTSLSDKIFKGISYMEEDGAKLVDMINEYAY